MTIEQRLQRLEQAAPPSGLADQRRHVDAVREIIETDPGLACACRDGATPDESGVLAVSGDLAERLTRALKSPG
jgi:hypothetical protein